MIKKTSSRLSRGSILVLVLVTLLLLSTVVLHVVQQAVSVAEDHIFLAQSAQAAVQAEAARGLVVELLAASGLQSDSIAPFRQNVWEQGDMRIIFLPANAKLNLNFLKPRTGIAPSRQGLEQAVTRLIGQAAMTSSLQTHSDTSVEDIIDWITPLDKLESSAALRRINARYDSDSYSYKPRMGPLERPEELLLVRGFQWLDPVFLRDHFTVWGNDDRLNLNCAPESILLALLPELKTFWPAIDIYRNEHGFRRPDELLSHIRMPMDLYQRVLPRIRLDADIFEALIEISLPAWYELHRIILEHDPLNTNTPVRILVADILEARPLLD